MSIARDEVLRIAELACLDLREEEVERLTAELNEILEHVAALAAAGLDRAPEESAAGAPLRDDVVAPDPLRCPLEEIAPEWRDGFFVLPRPGAHEGSGAAGQP